MATSPVVLGLDYGGTKIAAAVCDLAGNRLASTTVGSDAALGAQASFGRGIGVCRDLLSLTAPDGELVAVGVSTFGIPFEDRVELAPAIHGWDTLAMGPKTSSRKTEPNEIMSKPVLQRRGPRPCRSSPFCR